MILDRTGNIIHSEFVDNHLVEIVDQGDQRSLYFMGEILQSRISMTAPHELILLYTHYMMSALLVQPIPSCVLLIGIGAGALIHFLHYHYPNCFVDAVDNSGQIIRMALGFFGLPNKPPITLHCCDGLEFLKTKESKRVYDLILVDAFTEKGMSKTIYSESFFQLCTETLTSDGVLSCNLWSGDSEELLKVRNGLVKYSASQLYLPVTGRGNIIALAFKNPVPWEKFNRARKDIDSFSQRFNINFGEIIKVATKHNLPFGKRLGSFFQRHCRKPHVSDQENSK
jgi:spermidine synthase